jgi:hypothetical protein
MSTDENEKIYAEVSDTDENRSENLEGGKSTKVSGEEAKEEQSKAYTQKMDRQPEEVKASPEILQEDAEAKSDNSSGS